MQVSVAYARSKIYFLGVLYSDNAEEDSADTASAHRERNRAPLLAEFTQSDINFLKKFSGTL